MKYAKEWRILSVLFLTFCGLYAKQPIATVHTIPGKQEALLKFNLTPGEKYLFSSVIKQVITQEIMGQTVTTKQDMASDYIYDVQTVKDGITTINVTFSAQKMDTDVAGGMQQLHFDSADPDAGTAELKVLANLVGKSFVMQLNETGQVESIQGLAEIIDSIDTEHREILKQFFGDPSMIQSMNQMTNVYPDQAVSKGDRWTKSSSGSLAGMLHSTVTSEFFLSDINSHSATLSVDGKMVFSKLETGSNPLLQNADLNLNGSQKGTLEVDTKSGLPMQTTLTQQVTGTLGIQGMEIPINITSAITITGKKM